MNGNMHLTGFCSDEKTSVLLRIAACFSQTTESSLEMKAIKETYSYLDLCYVCFVDEAPEAGMMFSTGKIC